MDIVCFGQQNWDYCWTGKQHLMSRLAARGHRVLYVDPTWLEVGVTTGDPGLPRGVRSEITPRLFVHTHTPIPRAGWRVNMAAWPRLVRRAVRGLGFNEPVVIALRPPALPLVRALNPRSFVYYAVDEMTAFGDRTAEERRAVRASEDRILREADIALAVSRRLHRRFLTVQPRSYYLPNGADVSHFSPDALERASPHDQLRGRVAVRVGFVGQVDERLDQDLLRQIASARPDWEIALAGRVKPGTDVTTLGGVPNIKLLGYTDYDDLPGVLREVDVCTVPYHVNALTQACNPLKVFEYLATGRPVVASPLDGLKWCEDVIQTVPAEASLWVKAIERGLEDSPGDRAARLQRARANDWDDRVDRLEPLLDSLQGRHLRAPGSACDDWPLQPCRGFVPEQATPDDSRVADLGFGALRLGLFAGLTLVGWCTYLARWMRRRMTEPEAVAIRTIAVGMNARLGDAVILTPMLRALSAQFAGVRVDLLTATPGPQTEILTAQNLIDRVVQVREVGGLEVLSQAWRIFRRGYDLLITCGGVSIPRDAFFTGAPYRWGLEDGHPLEVLLTHRSRPDPRVHQAENYVRVLKASWDGVGSSRAPTVPEKWIARDAIGDEKTPGESGDFVVHIGAQKPSRRWSQDDFAWLVSSLRARYADHKIVLTGTSEDRDRNDGLRESLPDDVAKDVTSVAGTTSLAGLAGLLCRADLLVSNDTGVMHLARAVGTPLLALLGPENPDRWGPHPAGPAPAVALIEEVPCAPCKKWECRPHYCLRALDRNRVFDAVVELMTAGPASDDPGVDPQIQHTLRGLDRYSRSGSWRALAESGVGEPMALLLRRDSRSEPWVTEGRLPVWRLGKGTHERRPDGVLTGVTVHDVVRELEANPDLWVVAVEGPAGPAHWVWVERAVGALVRQADVGHAFTPHRRGDPTRIWVLRAAPLLARFGQGADNRLLSPIWDQIIEGIQGIVLLP